MKINERDVALRSGLTNYPALKDFMDRRTIIQLPFNEDTTINAGANNVVLVDSSMVVASNLSIGLGTGYNGGLFASLLAGAVGTGSTNINSDSLGNILNMVKVRDATTHDSITDINGREVYGLVQAVSTALDGDVIGASGSENVQLSFVVVDSGGALTLTNVAAVIEFTQHNTYLERMKPTIMLEGGNPTADALAVDPLHLEQGFYVVTTAFAPGEVITLSTGNGASAGVSTQSGDVIFIGGASGAFNSNNLISVLKNGVEQVKGTEVIYDSSGSLHFASPLDVDDTFKVKFLT